MTNSEIFRLAHARAKFDMQWQKDSNCAYPEKYSYHFRLHLLNLYAERKPMAMNVRMDRELMTDGRI